MKALKNLSLLTAMVLGLSMSTSAFADVNTFAATKGQVQVTVSQPAATNSEVKYLTSVDPKKDTPKSLRERISNNKNDQ